MTGVQLVDQLESQGWTACPSLAQILQFLTELRRRKIRVRGHWNYRNSRWQVTLKEGQACVQY